jgi:hypothetical protein
MANQALMALVWSLGWIRAVEGVPISCSGRHPKSELIESSTSVITPASFRTMRHDGLEALETSDWSPTE